MTVLPDNKVRAKNAIIVFCIQGCVILISIISTLMQISLIKHIREGNFNMEEAQANDSRQSLIAFGQVGVLIISAIVFILWFRRAYNNLNLSGRTYTKYGEGWAAGGWFVPFLNLVRPYQIMKEIWDKTQQATENLLTIKSSELVGWWWAAWIISNVVENIGVRMGNNDVDSLLTGSYFSVAGDVFSIIALILGVMIIKKTAEFEENLQVSLINEQTGPSDREDQLNFITSE